MNNMQITLYKFTGAGNDFVVIDGRKGDVSAFRTVERIGELCREYKTDGLMILTDRPLLEIPGTSPRMTVDFVMEFYNPDGTGGMMCGNGGRCITAFADMLGLKPAAADGTWHFLAPDGPHVAKILSKEPGKWTVRLKMIDVEGVTPMMGGYFLNTGTRHFVKFVDDVDSKDMDLEAKPLRWDPAFQPEGTNVNLVECRPDGLHIRTYEKGVEGETLACGTGITATAIASGNSSPVRLQCRRGDWLSVEFKKDGKGFRDVYLTGPAELVKTIELC
jgi:diaminopimelate epimerase